MKLKQKEELRKKALMKKKIEQSKKVEQLAKSWNPLPVKGKSSKRLSSTIEKHSNFINCKQQCMNVGKYKGINIEDVPSWYLKWAAKNIELNQSELTLIRKFIKLS
jgi:uncharacterized protein (DUF3820 family)